MCILIGGCLAEVGLALQVVHSDSPEVSVSSAHSLLRAPRRPLQSSSIDVSASLSAQPIVLEMRTRMCFDDVAWERSEAIQDAWVHELFKEETLMAIGHFILKQALHPETSKRGAG